MQNIAVAPVVVHTPVAELLVGVDDRFEPYNSLFRLCIYGNGRTVQCQSNESVVSRYNLIYYQAMLTLRRRTPYVVMCLKTTAILMFLGGIYVLSLVSSPIVRTVFVNPTDNPTTRLLAKKDTPKDAWLYVPKIDLNVPFGAPASALYVGAQWRQPSSGNPKDGGNFVLAGHRFVMSTTPGKTIQQSPFYGIDKLVAGDKIFIDYKGVRYTYTIRSKTTVKPDAVSIENRTVDPRLTLYSCTLGGQSDGRDVIIATP